MNSDHIIKALCNTLMHSLWQGVLLAVLTGVLIIFTKKASAAYRYNLLVVALILFTVGVLFTFIWQFRQLQLPLTSMSYQINATSNSPVTTEPTTPVILQTAKVNATETVTNYLNSHYNIIVLIWFLIICTKSLQMAVGLHSVFHLKRTKVFSVGKDWENRLLQLAEQLQIKRAVRLMDSGIAKVPMVIGHLKPLILIPLGLISSLTTDEVEAILIHELAHIKRRDYLVNILQNLMEIIFFFNPAVLWVSGLIRTERENCCDDLALEQNHNKVNYIRALVSCEEYQSSVPPYAMAFPGGKNTLLHRVKRMVSNRNYSLNMFEKTVLAICLVILGLAISAFTARENFTKALKSVAAAIHHDAKEHTEKIKAIRSDTIKNKLPLHPIAFKTTGGPELNALIHKIDNLRPISNLNSPLSFLPKPDTNTWKNLRAMIMDSSNQVHEIARELYREQLLTDTNHVSISLNERELIVNGVRMPQMVHDRIYRQFGQGGNDGSSHAQTYGINYSDSHGDNKASTYGINYSDSYGDNYAHPYGNRHPGPYDSLLQVRNKEIGYELVRENLVNDKNNFTYRLSNDELFIDGVKQSDALHHRIVNEYFKPGDRFDMSYTMREPGLKYSTEKYPDTADMYRNPYAYPQLSNNERQRIQDEIDKRLVADLLHDGLITDPNNVIFTMGDNKVTINGKIQSEEIYQKYKEKYMPAHVGPSWNWTYSHSVKK